MRIRVAHLGVGELLMQQRRPVMPARRRVLCVGRTVGCLLGGSPRSINVFVLCPYQVRGWTPPLTGLGV